MPAPVAFYVTGHGFGHASRVIEVINALLVRRSEVGVHVRTSASRWLFDLTADGRATVHDVECDTGVVQLDSLRPDIPETLRRAAAFHATLGIRAESEAEWLRRVGIGLVVADVPPLAFAAARLAGVPSVALGNFTWDWIYECYGPDLGEARWLPGTLRDVQSSAVEAWRLPMHGGFAGYARVVDLPFVARHARRDPRDVRRALRVDLHRPLALVSFGGFGLEGLPLDAVAAGSGFTVVTTAVPGPADDAPARDGPISRATPGGVVVVGEGPLYAAGFRYEDLVAAADAVVTKPGYGIISECVANGTAMLYTSRGAFAEYDVLVREMPRHLRCRFIDHHDLLAGRWARHLEALLASPGPVDRPRTDGAEVASARVLSHLDAPID